MSAQDRYPLLVAAPGMTMGEIAAASSARFDMPDPADERGIIQPREAHRVRIEHPIHGIEIPAGLFTLVDVNRSVATRVTATPCLEYIDVPATVDLLHLVDERAKAAKWDPIQTPNHSVLGRELPKVTGEVLLGEWNVDRWKAEMRVRAALEAGSEEAQLAGMPDGGFLTTIIVWDPELFR